MKRRRTNGTRRRKQRIRKRRTGGEELGGWSEGATGGKGLTERKEN